MRRRLDDLRGIVDQLQQTAELPSLHTPVHIRVEPAVDVLTCSGHVTAEQYGPFLHQAFADLAAAVETLGVVAVGSGSACYPAQVDAADEPVLAYLEVAGTAGVVDVARVGAVVGARLPRAVCAVATHVGGYDSIGDTYRTLGAWVARHARPRGRARP